VRRHFAFALLLATLPPGTAGAQVRPEPGQGDIRIQHVQYAPEQVVLIEAVVGYQVTVKLAPDEQVQSIAVGDAGAWQVSANGKGDHLFVKPLQGGQSTNMTVITDTRLYAFELSQPARPARPPIWSSSDMRGQIRPNSPPNYRP
jgi:type IV secretion system protein VirB9